MEKMKQTTLIEAAGRDWGILEAMAREASVSDIEANPERKTKLINRAVNSRYLTKDARPQPDDEDLFIGALLQRYVEAIDELKPDDDKRLAMIGRLALTIDGLRGLEWVELRRYEQIAPELKTKNVYTTWSDAAANSAKLIRGDLGTEPLPYKSHKKRPEETSAEATSALGIDTIEGFEDLRGTIIDMLYDDAAGDVSSDIAAALLVGLGIDKPTRSVSPEKLDAYKDNILKWLSVKLSASKQQDGTEERVDSLRRGRVYLREVAGHYPTKGKLSAAEWVVMRQGVSKAEYVRHVESHMAFALHHMFTKTR